MNASENVKLLSLTKISRFSDSIVDVTENVAADFIPGKKKPEASKAAPDPSDHQWQTTCTMTQHPTTMYSLMEFGVRCGNAVFAQDPVP